MTAVLESLFLGRELYFEMLSRVSEKHFVTNTELIVLMFLRSEEGRDTASDISRSFDITKSAVSMAVRELEERGLITGCHRDGNRRTVHLRLDGEAEAIADEGLRAQGEFIGIITDGLSEHELRAMQESNSRIAENIKKYRALLRYHEKEVHNGSENAEKLRGEDESRMRTERHDRSAAL